MDSLVYESKSTVVSDHKPVLAYFNIKLYSHITNLYEDYSEKVNPTPIEHFNHDGIDYIDEVIGKGIWVFYSAKLEE